MLNAIAGNGDTISLVGNFMKGGMYMSAYPFDDECINGVVYQGYKVFPEFKKPYLAVVKTTMTEWEKVWFKALFTKEEV